MSYPASMQAGIVPGPEPGTIMIPGLGMQKLTDWREDTIYDTELMPVTIQSGQTFTFFRNLAIAGVPKTRWHTNMVTPSQLPSGHMAIIYGIHFRVELEADPYDAQVIYNNAYIEFVTGDTKREKSGPMVQFPSPYGMSGSVSLDGNAAPVFYNIVNNGIPSPTSIGKLHIPITLTNELTFWASVIFYNACTLSAVSFLHCELRAYINTPVR